MSQFVPESLWSLWCDSALNEAASFIGERCVVDAATDGLCPCLCRDNLITEIFGQSDDEEEFMVSVCSCFVLFFSPICYC